MKEGRIELKEKRELRRKKRLDERKEETGYLKFKEEALDRTV
jgi:hypothetical protein